MWHQSGWLKLLMLLLQAEELQAAHASAQEAAAQAASAQQLLSGLQADKASLAQQVKKLTAEKASLSEQLGSSAGDIDMLQVRWRQTAQTGLGESQAACT